MKVTTAAGGGIELQQSVVDQFQAGLRGPLLFPGDPRYEESRTLWNGMIDRRPAMVARCLGAADVIRCVSLARDHGLRFSIKGGGHNIAGLAACDGGLMMDLSSMRGVWVDPGRRIARAQAGCLLGDVDRETQLHGLAAVLGFVSNTGIAGLTLGGGMGYLTRKYGWTTDNLTAVELVTAEGRLVRASEDDNPDLFWGLRGGGGNFGVATSFEYTLYPLGPEIMAGAIAWPVAQAPEVLELFQRLTEQGPPELTLAVALRPAPPAPWIAREWHGKPAIAMFVCHTGPLADGERDVAQIKAFGTPVGDIVERRPYLSQQSLIDATQPKGRRYYWKSEYLPRLGPDLFARAMEHAARITSPHGAVIFFPIGGALNRLPLDHSPAGNRDANVLLNITAAWDDPAEDPAQIDWARSTWRDMRSFSTGGTYVNFLTEEEGGDRVQAAYGANLDRLVEVKRRWDPENLFRANQNIAPSIGR